MDAEGKIPRGLNALGSLAGRDVAVLDVPGTDWLERLRAAGLDPLVVPVGVPLHLDAPDESLDAIVTLWTGFRGVDPAELAEADRALRPGGRLLVVHDYGRDDVSTLRDPGAPEYGAWSRREGPFLRHAGFRVRVLHCFWTFATLEEAREALAEFGERGEALGARLKRPRLSWNVAVYHRLRNGVAPEDASGAR
jgi:SAM-dependent methyltransferase